MNPVVAERGYQSSGVNYAANLPAFDNSQLSALFFNRVAGYLLRQLELTFPLHLLLNIQTTIDLCESVTYLCEDTDDSAALQDTALDSIVKRERLGSPPKAITFSGYNVASMEFKIASDQLYCINRSPILRQWYMNSLNRALENGKQAIFRRFYRHLMNYAVHPDNTGNQAGMLSHNAMVGSPTQPILVNNETVDYWLLELLKVAKEMPTMTMLPDNFYGMTAANLFAFAPYQLEDIYMKAPSYNTFWMTGACASCTWMQSVFDKHPRGFFHITTPCLDRRVIKSGDKTCYVYPVLFGVRYRGTQAALQTDMFTYQTQDRESLIIRINFRYQIYTYDCRFMGVSWIMLEETHPPLAVCGV